MFSAFSWPQARLSGLSATHCVAVTCGKRQPEPASQLLVATWKSSVHFLPSVCVCIINSVSLCELSIMYLNTCPSVNDVLRCAHTMAAVPAPTAPCTAAAGGGVGGKVSRRCCRHPQGAAWGWVPRSGSRAWLRWEPARWEHGEIGSRGVAGCRREDGDSWHQDGAKRSPSPAGMCQGTPMSHPTDAGSYELMRERNVPLRT